jgi:hypothetical protein
MTTTVRTRPLSVTVAVGALLAQAAWAVVNAILVLANQDTLHDAIESAAREEGMSSYDIRSTVEVGMFVNVVVGTALAVALLAATIFLVRLDLRGRPIGRTLTFAACGLLLGMTVLNTCFGLAASSALPGGWRAFTMIGNLFYIAVYITVIQLLRREDAARFFAP